MTNAAPSCVRPLACVRVRVFCGSAGGQAKAPGLLGLSVIVAKRKAAAWKSSENAANLKRTASDDDTGNSKKSALRLPLRAAHGRRGVPACCVHCCTRCKVLHALRAQMRIFRKLIVGSLFCSGARL